LRLRTIITDRYKLNHYAGKPFGELFDLREDPREQHNLWDDPKFKKLKLELKEHLLDLYIQQESVHPRRVTHA
jgi:arylsulfatase A-like enzyme